MSELATLEQRLEQELLPEQRSSTLLDLAEQYRSRDLPRALGYARQALEGAGAVPAVLYRAHLELARCLTDSGDFGAALEHLELALGFAQDSTDPPLRRMAVQHARAIVYDLMADYTHALELFTQNLHHLSQEQHTEKYADTLNSIAIVHARAGNHAAALGCLTEARALYETLNQTLRSQVIRVNMGLVCRDLGDLEQAQSHLEGALEYLQDEKLLTFRAVALVNLSELYLSTARESAALLLLHEALELSLTKGLKYQEVVSRSGLGHLYNRQGHFQEAEEQFRQALLVLAFTPNVQRESEVRERLALSYSRRGMFEPAFLELERVRELEKQHFGAEYQDKIRVLQVRFDVEKAHKDAELERLKTVELEGLLREKETLMRQLEVLSITDGLTGLYNRRHLDHRARDLVAQASAQQRPLCIALADLDFFKKVNDTFGHATGDEVLRRTAQIYRDTVRPGDLVARYGGEEFALVMPDTPLEQALEVLERVRHALECHPWHEVHPELRVTLSAGVSDALEWASHEKMLQEADHWLYQAKHRGKNQVCSRVALD